MLGSALWASQTCETPSVITHTMQRRGWFTLFHSFLVVSHKADLQDETPVGRFCLGLDELNISRVVGDAR
jgi:hypothetical protein